MSRDGRRALRSGEDEGAVMDFNPKVMCTTHYFLFLGDFAFGFDDGF
jgi:hypothetical protein